ncbi:MAG: Rpn family recombination-promoting nuclease/putative transposase [Clostridium sp.]|uniref:Rpn family recombination-promoting nuclease/putative transposase n=1 Tax=Clostridium sp. TaxID=1506 RepID=UPI0025C5F528|nr:Rpn family recombination-promoting nuclease/putative transposase [Clostridium sp.]MCI9304381.1 Rpn family recombination-promoting nuclease/putative transposase [Clostridium sp.]
MTRLEILSPKVDFVFKRIFGNERNPKILISFLNAVIKPKDLIKSVQIMNTDIEKESIEDKFSRLDIKAKTNKDKFIENPISNKLEKAEMTIQEIKEAKDELFRLSANDKERMKYEDRRAALLDKISALENAEEKGKIEVARKSLEAGLDINTISSITGLDISEIEKLL